MTTSGRIAGIGIMLTGVAVLGILAGSLASLFHIDTSKDDDTPSVKHIPLQDEIAALRMQLRSVEQRLGE